MRVLGFIPELTVTAWAVVRAGPGRGKKRKDEFSIDLDVTGSCRISQLPALFKTLPAPDLIAIPEPPWRWVGQRIGVRRIVRACRHRVDFPEPVLITTDETRDTLCGSTEFSGEAFLERFFMLMPGAAHLFASDDTPSAEGLARICHQKNLYGVQPCGMGKRFAHLPAHEEAPRETRVYPRAARV